MLVRVLWLVLVLFSPFDSSWFFTSAVAAASAAAAGWAATPVGERCALVDRIADRIMQRFDEFVAAESLDCGKPLRYK
jgi:acyl-CoA reductase-like NAD-dependent aldehyde dehydrogenase